MQSGGKLTSDQIIIIIKICGPLYNSTLHPQISFVWYSLYKIYITLKSEN